MTRVPKFIKDLDPERLRQSMFLNDLNKGTTFEYQVVFAKGKWYAWYFEETGGLNERNIVNK